MKDFVEDTSDALRLREDLAELKRRFGGDGKIHMELNFSSRYPIEPPMIRVVSPRMLQYTGNVTIGGAVCSEFSVEKYHPDFEISEIMRMVRLNMLTAPKVVVNNTIWSWRKSGTVARGPQRPRSFGKSTERVLESLGGIEFPTSRSASPREWMVMFA